MTPTLSTGVTWSETPSPLLLGVRSPTLGAAATDRGDTKPKRSEAILADIATGVVYFALASISLALTRLGGGFALFFVANAVLVARLWSLPVRAWPRPIVIAFGACVVAGLSLSPMMASLGGHPKLIGPVVGMLAVGAAANMVDVAVATLLLRRWIPRGGIFETARSVLVFVLAAGIVGPALGGAIASTAGAILLRLPWESTWINWIVGRGLGTLIMAPMVILVTSGEFNAWRRGLTRRSAAETLLLLGFVALVTIGVFAQSRLPLLFLPMLPVLVITFVLGQVGAAMAVILVAVIGGALTVHGVGPVLMVKGSEIVRFQFFQLYTASTFLIALPVAGALKQREKLLAALQESETRYRLLADNVSDAIFSISRDGTILYASPSVRDLAGFEPASLVARNSLDIIYPDDVARVRALHLKALQMPDRTFTIDYRVTTASGAVEWFETRTKAVRSLTGEVDGVISAIRSIGERKQLENQLREAAETDPLTGLANRRALVHHLNAAIVEGGKGRVSSLAMLDLDFFKRVNDEHGHAVGDTTLMLLADICRELVRSNDVVARIGGEEFALLLVGADVTEASRVCNRLRQKIDACEVPVGPGRSIHITASIGVSAVNPGTIADDILAAADAALYRAKHAGRNCVVACE